MGARVWASMWMSCVPTGRLALSQDQDRKEKPCSAHQVDVLWCIGSFYSALTVCRHSAHGSGLIFLTAQRWRNHCFLHPTGEETGTEESRTCLSLHSGKAETQATRMMTWEILTDKFPKITRQTPNHRSRKFKDKKAGLKPTYLHLGISYSNCSK